MKIFEFGNGQMKIAIVGSLHGNETIGKRIVERLAREKDINAKIKAIVANEEAIAAGKRFVDIDGNRCFPGKSNGNTEERMAFRILKELKGYKHVLDLHSTYSSMPDTAIITKRRSLKLARMAPVGKILLMGRSIAKGGAINDYPDLCISLEFNYKTKPDIVYDIVTQTISNLMAGKPSRIKQDVFLVKGFLNGKGKPRGISNYKSVKKGELIAIAGKRKVFAKENFYPVFLGEKGYKNALCMKAVKVKN